MVTKAGDTMSGNLNMGGNKITNAGDATNGSDVINMIFFNVEKWTKIIILIAKIRHCIIITFQGTTVK